jgi:hypothetical protein
VGTAHHQHSIEKMSKLLVLRSNKRLAPQSPQSTQSGVAFDLIITCDCPDDPDCGHGIDFGKI